MQPDVRIYTQEGKFITLVLSLTSDSYLFFLLTILLSSSREKLREDILEDSGEEASDMSDAAP